MGWPRHLGVVLGLGVVILLTFSNTLHNTDFALDNKFIILEDPRLRKNTPENRAMIFHEDYWWPKAVSGLYRPLTTLSYMFNYAILGNANNATAYHWVNVLVHWLDAILVYFLALVLLEAFWPGLGGQVAQALGQVSHLAVGELRLGISRLGTQGLSQALIPFQALLRAGRLLRMRLVMGCRKRAQTVPVHPALGVRLGGWQGQRFTKVLDGGGRGITRPRLLAGAAVPFRRPGQFSRLLEVGGNQAGEFAEALAALLDQPLRDPGMTPAPQLPKHGFVRYVAQQFVFKNIFDRTRKSGGFPSKNQSLAAQAGQSLERLISQ